MTRTITLGSRTVIYELQRKNVKNINLRIHPDGRMTVSAHPCVSEERIERFLTAKAARICAALDHFEEEAQGAPPLPTYADGDVVCFLGQARRIRTSLGTRNDVVDDGATLLLTLTDPSDEALRIRAAERFMIVRCRETLASLVADAQRRMAPMGVPVPTLRFRRMRSRWGSCHPQKGIVTLNDALFSCAIPLLEYVVYHELVHFLVPDHSARFYQTLEEVLPDWADRRRMLREPPKMPDGE